MTSPQPEVVAAALTEAAVAAAAVANFCDHAEHLEDVDRGGIIDAAFILRTLALRLAEADALDIFDLYAARLSSIEARNVLAPIGDFDGGSEARGATTWTDLQHVQARHDELYHPDVFGLSRAEQLRHYSFHLSKLVGALAELTDAPERWQQFARQRLPDILLFGIKLSTLVNAALPAEPLR